MNRANLGLWSAIAGIFLLAILGIRSAANWLAASTPSEPSNQTLTVTGSAADGGTNADRELLVGSSSQAPTETQAEADLTRDRINAQTGQATNPSTGQRGSDALLAQQTQQPSDPLTFSPLEEAGTYIQRQKRVERDAFVAATRVEAVPLNTVTAQSDTQGTQSAPSSLSSGTQASQTRSAQQTSPAIPARW